MDLPNSVCDHGLSGFWNRILLAWVPARAGLSEACPISYIQYIGVVSAALPSPGSAGGRPNSPIGMCPSKPGFASQYSGCCVIKRQCAERLFTGCQAHGLVIVAQKPLFAALEQRARPARTVQEHKKYREGDNKQHRVDQQRVDHQVGAKHMVDQ